MIQIPAIPVLEAIYFPPQTHQQLAKRCQDMMDDTWVECTAGLDQDVVIQQMKKHKHWNEHQALTEQLYHLQRDGSLAQYQWGLERLFKMFTRIVIDSL